MTLKIVKSEIARFLAAIEPEVLALKGAWGIGKTYTWKKLIRDLSKTMDLPTHRYSYKNGWGRKDIEIMSNASEDEYYQIFKNENGDHLHSFINACLQFNRIGNTSEKEKLVASKAEAVLRRIAEESEINRRRVASYGIKVNRET